MESGNPCWGHFVPAFILHSFNSLFISEQILKHHPPGYILLSLGNFQMFYNFNFLKVLERSSRGIFRLFTYSCSKFGFELKSIDLYKKVPEDKLMQEFRIDYRYNIYFELISSLVKICRMISRSGDLLCWAILEHENLYFFCANDKHYTAL